MSFEAVIGLEVHAQLLTRSKLFCACSAQFGAAPNEHTCPVCMAFPGVLPVTNRQAVEFAIRAGLAVGSTIAPQSRWARKNYFYPDLPKAYQISMYEAPICVGGIVRFQEAEVPSGRWVDAGGDGIVDGNRLRLVVGVDSHRLQRFRAGRKARDRNGRQR